MKKLILLLAVLIIIALLAVTPFFVGKTAEAQFYNAQNQVHNLGIDVTSTYTRGWFSARAESRASMYDIITSAVPVKYRDGLLAMTSYVVHTVHEIEHGPIVLNSFDGYHPIYKPVIAAIKNDTTLYGPTNVFSKPVRFTTFSAIDIDGSYDTAFSLTSGMHTVYGPRALKLSYDTVSADLDVSRDFNAFSFGLVAPCVSLINEDSSFTISNIVFASDMDKGIYDIALHTVHCDITNITLTTDGGREQINFNDVSIKYEIREINSNIAFTTDVVLQSLDADDDHYGPVALSYTIRNIDPEVLLQLRNIIENIQRSQWNKRNAEVNNFLLMSQLMTVAQQLLEKSPEIEVSTLEINTPDGLFKGKMLVTFHPVESINLLNMFSLLQIITADLNVAMPAGFVEEHILSEKAQRENPQMVFLGSLLKKSGTNYVLDAELKNGTMTVNGQPIPLPLLTGQQ